MAIATKWWVLVKLAYLATFFLAADSAAAPASTLVPGRWEVASVSGAVTSHVRHLPLRQGMRVQPSGLLPSSRRRPEGSLFDGRPALIKARWTRSLSRACLVCRATLRRHARPCVPLAST